MTAGIPGCDTNQFMPQNTGSSVPLNRWLVYIVDLGDATEAVRLRAVLGNSWGKVELIEGLDTLRTRLDDLIKPQLVVLLHEQFKDEWLNIVDSLAENRPKILFLGVGEKIPSMNKSGALAETLSALDDNSRYGFCTHATWKQLEDPKSLSDLLQRLGEIHSRRHQGPKKHY
jgi:hypothetical protein